MFAKMRPDHGVRESQYSIGVRYRERNGFVFTGSPSWAIEQQVAMDVANQACKYKMWYIDYTKGLSFKQLGNLSFNVVLFSNIVLYKCNIFIWNGSNIMNINSAL